MSRSVSFGVATLLAVAVSSGCAPLDQPLQGDDDFVVDAADAGVEDISDKSQAIINGIPVGFDYIFPRVGNGCSSMLLSNRWAVTAAHCLNGSFYLDRAFDGDGEIWRAIPLLPVGQAVDSSGRRLALGWNVAFSRYEVWRFTASGATDTSFGGGDGRFEVPAAFSAGALSVDSSGRPILAGGTNSMMAAMRLATDGSPDPSFGVLGLVAFDFASRPYEYAQSVLIMPDASIFLGGFAQDAAGARMFAMAKLRGTNGVLDTAFAGDGKVLPAIGTTSEEITDLSLVNGKILASGPGTFSGRKVPVLARFFATGNTAAENLDAAFGSLGAAWYGWFASGLDTTPTNPIVLSNGNIGLGFNLQKAGATLSGLLILTSDGIAMTTGGTTNQGVSWFQPDRNPGNESRMVTRVARDPASNLVIAIGAVAGQGWIMGLSGTGGTEYTGALPWARLGGMSTWFPMQVHVASGKTAVLGVSVTNSQVTVNSLLVMRAYNFSQTVIDSSPGLDLTLTLGGESRTAARIVRIPGQDSALVQVQTGFTILGFTTGWSWPSNGFVEDWNTRPMPHTVACYGWGVNVAPDQGAGVLRVGTMLAATVGSPNITLTALSSMQATGAGDSGGACLAEGGTKYAGTISRGNDGTFSLIARSEGVATRFRSAIATWGY